MASHQLPTKQISGPKKIQVKEPSIPEYFQIMNEYDKIKVGYTNQPVTIVDTSDYDYYILAGISEDEIFSKMLISNMNILDGCAIDLNPRVTNNFPQNLKMLKKKVSYHQDKVHEDLSFFSKKFSNMFLKMNLKGDEYLWVLSQTIDCLNCFKQMVITFSDVNQNPTKQRADNKIKCFTKLKESHNIAFMNFNGSDLTITYIRKDLTPSVVSEEKETIKKMKLEMMKKESSESKNFEKEEIITKKTMEKKISFDMNVEETHYQSIQNKALERAKREEYLKKLNVSNPPVKPLETTSKLEEESQEIMKAKVEQANTEKEIAEEKAKKDAEEAVAIMKAQTEQKEAEEKAKKDAEEAEAIMKAQAEQKEAEEKAKKDAEEAEAIIKAQTEQKEAEEKAKKDAEEAEAIMKAQIEQAEAEEKARIEAENAKTKEESENKETKEEVESEEEKKIREIQEAEAIMQAQIEQAEAVMAAEIAKAEAATKNETENLELQINEPEEFVEIPKLELDEASSDDEEEERERERLKQQSVNQL